MKNDNSWINPQNKKEIKQDNILCSSGTNYIVIKEDGQIYRCFHDLSPIGTIHNLNLKKNATPCNVGYICDSSSDQMFCTQWNQVNKKGYYTKNPICISWKDKDPNQIDSNNICMIIYPTMRCNFRCSYCCNYYPSSENDIRPKYEDEISTNQWIDFFDKIKNQYKNTVINLNGGEPLLYKDIDILIQKIIDCNFDGSIVTNFSVFKQLDKILNVRNIDNFKFTTTLHPINKNFNFDKILEYIIKFSNKGIKQRIVVLGWQDNIPYYEKWKPIFKTLNIPLWLKWCGGYEYTQDHIQYLLKEGAGKSTAQYLDEIGWNKKMFKKINTNKEKKDRNFISLDSKKYPSKKNINHTHINDSGKHLFHKNKNVICTSGLDYCVVNVSGLIFKCYGMHDHNSEEAKLGTLDDYNSIWDRNDFTCSEMKCNEACEGYKVEVWDQNKKRVFLNHKIKWRKLNNYINQVSKDNFYIQADLLAGCFNNCPYCFTGFKNVNKKDIKTIDSKKIMNLLTEIAKRKKGIKIINISGSGEPLLHPDFEEIINYATSLDFSIELISSCLLNNYKIFNLNNTEKITLIISLHPLSQNWNFENFEEFAKKISNIKFANKLGSLVDYKDNIPFADQLKRLCDKNNIYFYKCPYWEFHND